MGKEEFVPTQTVWDDPVVLRALDSSAYTPPFLPTSVPGCSLIYRYLVNAFYLTTTEVTLTLFWNKEVHEWMDAQMDGRIVTITEAQK